MRLYPESLMKSSRHKFELGHVDKLCMLRTCVYWGARLEPVDPYVTSTAMCQTVYIGNPPRERARQRKRTERIAICHQQSTITSTLGSYSGSEHPVMRAKHFEAAFTPISSSFHHYFSSSITHQLLMHGRIVFFFGIGTRDVMNNLHYIPSPSSIAPRLLYAAIIRQTAHAPYTRKLGRAA